MRVVLLIAELVVHPEKSSTNESLERLVEFAAFEAAVSRLPARDLRWNVEHHMAEDRSVTLAVQGT